MTPKPATMTTASFQELLDRIRPFGQDHLLRFWDRLDPAAQRRLAEQIGAIDFAEVARLFAQRDADDGVRALAERATSPPALRLGAADPRFPPEDVRRRAAEDLAAGHVGVVLVAGGQGTRLGFPHPKGMFPIGPVSGCSLFQIHFEKVLATARRYGRPVPLFLMTSRATHEETVAYIERHDRFGLPREDLTVFCQGTMPAVDAETGKILLEAAGALALSPDGHGGMLAALARCGGLDRMRARGIERLFYLQVDNPLVDICGLDFLGAHLLAGSEASTQVVAKRSPQDRVGNVVSVDGRLQVIEYSDLPDDVAERRKADGSLAIWAGSIAVHVFEADFLAREAERAGSLPFHVARKKVAHLDASGHRVEPEQPNALKFERFIFDLLPAAERAIVVEVDPATAFAPLKNASGAESDTPESVQAAMVNLHAAWVHRAGIPLAEGTPVEISPLFALDAAEFARKVVPGTRIEEPTYFA